VVCLDQDVLQFEECFGNCSNAADAATPDALRSRRSPSYLPHASPAMKMKTATMFVHSIGQGSRMPYPRLGGRGVDLAGAVDVGDDVAVGLFAGPPGSQDP
jgi:hypothetical protein